MIPKCHLRAFVRFDFDRWQFVELVETLATRLELPMPESDSGRFDEVPAYVLPLQGGELIVFAPPYDTEVWEYQLDFFVGGESVEAIRAVMPRGVQSAIVDKPPRQGGVIDCSKEFCVALKALGFGDCIAPA